MKRSLSLLRVGLAAGALMMPAIAQTSPGQSSSQAQSGAGSSPATGSDTTTTPGTGAGTAAAPGTGAGSSDSTTMPNTGAGNYSNRGNEDRDRGRGFNFGWLGLVGLAGLLGLRRHSNPTITTRSDRNIEPR